MSPENSYHFIHWQTLAGQPLHLQATIHESLHADLNDSTGYGGLLHVVAYLARHPPTRARYAPLLEQLQARCRRTHESFATSLDVLLGPPEERAANLLEEHPDYRTYLAVGTELSRPFAGRFLRYHAIAAALRFCMQSCLIRRVVEQGLDSLEAEQIRWFEAPDRRLNEVRRVVTPALWEAALIEVRTACPEPSGWAHIEVEEAAGRAGRWSEAVQAVLHPDPDQLSHHIMQAFHEALDRVLSPRGMPSLAFDGHVPLVPPLLEQAYRILPPTASDGHLLRVSGDETPEELAIRQFQHEHLVMASDPFPARLFRLGQSSAPTPPEWLTGEGPDRHLFVCVRLAERLLASYALLAPDQAWLRAHAHIPIVTVRRSSLDASASQRSVDLLVLEEPAEFEAFLGALPPGVSCLCSFSMAAAGDEHWVARWYTPLADRCSMVGLFDLSPFLHLTRWSQQHTFDIHLGQIQLQDGSQTHCVMACWPDTGRSAVFVTLCTPRVWQAILYWSRELVEPRGRFVESEQFIRDRQRYLIPVLRHLAREERIFDFDAGHRPPPPGAAA